jgi:hypothetical protein
VKCWVSGDCRVLEQAQYLTLADALGDTPETVQSVHLLRRGNCRAYVAGDVARFDGAIVQAIDWPEEPTGFGSDPAVLWTLLQGVRGWTCILVDSGCAPALAAIMEAERGWRTRFLDDVTHVLTGPATVYRDKVVRRMEQPARALEGRDHRLCSGVRRDRGDGTHNRI